MTGRFDQAGPSAVQQAPSFDLTQHADRAASADDAPRPTAVSPEDGEVGDDELIARVRAGDGTAFDLLYRRHVEAVRRYALRCCQDRHTAEDLTGEVFARMLKALRGGSGPDVAVRAYLLTTVRRVAAAWAKTARHEQLVADFAVFAEVVSNNDALSRAVDAATGPAADAQAMETAERTLALRAFRSLPERWQTVLWHTAVEQESPSQVAPLLGLTPNATAVLAHRAREGLRQAYLQAHVSDALQDREVCARYADRLGAHARGALRLRASRELRDHLTGCAWCSSAYLELSDINACLRLLLPTAVVGWFAVEYTGATMIAAGSAAGTAVVPAVGGHSASGAGGTAAQAGQGAGVGHTGTAGATASGRSLTGVGKQVVASLGASVVAVAVVAALTMTMADHPKGRKPAKPQHQLEVSASPSAPATKSAPRGAAPRGATPTPADTVRVTPRRSSPPSAALPSPTNDAPQTRAVTPSEPVPEVSSSPTSAPRPSPPRRYPLSRLGWGWPGRATNKPTVRIGGSSWPLARHRMRMGGQRYEQGVTVAAPSSITIDLNRACISFDAVVGVDDLALSSQAVRFSVYSDKGLLFRSKTIHRKDSAIPVHIALPGVRTVRLVVTTGHTVLPVNAVDWAESRFTCQR